MRLQCSAWLLVVTLGLIAAQSLAQGTSVQLPTYSFSGVSTTVTVPDRGSAYLGGINRAASGRNEFGAPILGKLPFVGRGFKNTAIGQDRSSSSFRVTATIHDFEAMEEALLNGQSSSLSSSSPARRLADTPAAMAGRALQPRSPNLAGNWQPKAASDARSGLNLGDEQARRASQQRTREEEAEDLFARGQKAEAAGKTSVARLYYQMVSRRTGGQLKQQALARLEVLGGGQTKVAQREP